MARIRINDLPAAEALTPEQEGLVEGAGLRPFRPTLEGLEDRQLMATHLAAALPMQPPALGTAVSSQQPAGALEVSLPQGEQDPRKVLANEAIKKFDEVMGKNRFDNKWMLQRVIDTDQWYPAGYNFDRIRVKLIFTHGFFDDSNKGSAVLEFRRVYKDSGGRQSWQFDGVSDVCWKGVIGTGGWDHDLEDRIREVYKGFRCTFTGQVWSAPRANSAPPSGIAAGQPGADAGSQPSPVLVAVQQHKDNPTLSQARADTATTDALFASLKDNERP